jgi:hypothetical protein
MSEEREKEKNVYIHSMYMGNWEKVIKGLGATDFHRSLARISFPVLKTIVQD